MADSLIKRLLIMYCLIGIIVYSLSYFVDDLITAYSMNYTSPLGTFKATSALITGWTTSNMSSMQSQSQDPLNVVLTGFGIALNGVVMALLGVFMVVPTTGILLNLLFQSFELPIEFYPFIWGAILVAITFSAYAILKNQET